MQLESDIASDIRGLFGIIMKFKMLSTETKNIYNKLFDVKK